MCRQIYIILKMGQTKYNDPVAELFERLALTRQVRGTNLYGKCIGHNNLNLATVSSGVRRLENSAKTCLSGYCQFTMTKISD